MDSTRIEMTSRFPRNANKSEYRPEIEQVPTSYEDNNTVAFYVGQCTARVPEWNTYYPNLSQASDEQREFYELWRDNFERSIAFDVEGNLSYLFVYIYEVIGRFIEDKNIDRLLTSFQRIRTNYDVYEKIRDYPLYYTVEAWLYLRNYDAAWASIKTLPRPLGISDVINVKANCKDTAISGDELLSILGDSCLTPFGRDHQAQIAELITVFLQDFHKEQGKNFIEYFCGQFKLRNLTDDDFDKLEAFFPNQKEFNALKRTGIYVHPSREQYLFSGVPLNSSFANERLKIKDESIPYIVRAALTSKGRQIVRECENTFREESGIPKIGEGWIRETELFYKLCDAFPSEQIVHHGRPEWLLPQHLDIYFTTKNVACEYQGAQHQNPVEYFGGDESFREQLERDRRKKRLCSKHGCCLLYVCEDYDFEKVRLTIADVLDAANREQS